MTSNSNKPTIKISSPSQNGLLQISNNQYTYHSPNITPNCDRYIPNRSLSNLEASYHLLSSNKSCDDEKNDTNYLRTKSTRQTKVLNLSNRASEDLDKLSEDFNSSKKSKNSKRKIPSKCDLVLDAPDVNDDFYLNLLDWSCSDKLAVGLDKQIYIWNHRTKKVSPLLGLSNIQNENQTNNNDFYISSLKWKNDGQTLAIAKSCNLDNFIEFWDVNRQICVSKIKENTTRIATLAWNNNVLSSGSFDGKILNHDFRSNEKISEYNHHTKQICGLSWSCSGRFLASGGDDCSVCVWDSSGMSSSLPYQEIREHSAAVKAVAWCPWQNNLLATGGGKADGCIKMWNIYNGIRLGNVDTGSQVSGLVWSSKYREILSSHDNIESSLIIWKYPKLDRVSVLRGHVKRVLSVCLSASGEMVASLGADQTIRFWECFKFEHDSSVLSSPVSIRNLRQVQNIR